MKTINLFVLALFAFTVVFSQGNNVNELSANAAVNNKDNASIPTISLIRGEYLGISNLFSIQNEEHNPNKWSDSLAQSRIAEIFKMYYYSKPKDNAKSTLKVHPNASNGKVYIGLAADILDEVRLVDQNGKIVLSRRDIGKSFFTLDFNNLAKGNYYLQVSGNREFSTKQVVKL